MTMSLNDRIGLGLPLLALVALSGAIGVKLGIVSLPELHDARHVPMTVTVPSHPLTYRAEGSWLADGSVVEPPLVTLDAPPPLVVMHNEVTVAEYGACVAEGACRPAELGSRASRPDFPVTGVSFDDATDFAKWLGARTGLPWRLPSIAEWHFLAADAPPAPITEAENAANPALRWLAAYEREAALAATGPARLAPVGTGGTNRYGVGGLDNSVWEWTSTCLVRVTMDTAGALPARLEACGAHYLEGRHRAEMSNFITNGATGGCSTGRPPDHLGFRLVRNASEFDAGALSS